MPTSNPLLQGFGGTSADVSGSSPYGDLFHTMGGNVGGGSVGWGEGINDTGSRTSGFSSQRSSSSGASGIEQWYQDYEKDLLRRAQEQSEQGYTPYGGERVAGFNADQLAAMDMIRNAAENPAWQPYVDQWASVLRGVPGMMGEGADLIHQSAEYSPDGFNELYSTQYGPAVQALQAEAQRVGLQDFSNTTLADLNRKFAGTGGWGGSRNQILGADAAARAQAEIAGRKAGFEMQGRTSAAQDYLNWAKQGTSAGQGLIGAGQGILGGAQAGLEYGTDIQGAIGSDASALGAIGQQQQDLAQRGLDVDYENFLKEQAFPWDQINRYSDVLKATPPPQWTTNASSGSQESSNVSDSWGSSRNYDVNLGLPSGYNVTTGNDLGAFMRGAAGGLNLYNQVAGGSSGGTTGGGSSSNTGSNPANIGVDRNSYYW